MELNFKTLCAVGTLVLCSGDVWSMPCDSSGKSENSLVREVSESNDSMVPASSRKSENDLVSEESLVKEFLGVNDEDLQKLRELNEKIRRNKKEIQKLEDEVANKKRDVQKSQEQYEKVFLSQPFIDEKTKSIWSQANRMESGVYDVLKKAIDEDIPDADKIRLLRDLMKIGLDVNTRFQNRFSVLEYAIKNGQSEEVIIALIKEFGASPSDIACIDAVKEGRVELFPTLMPKEVVSTFYRNDSKFYPIHDVFTSSIYDEDTSLYRDAVKFFVDLGTCLDERERVQLDGVNKSMTLIELAALKFEKAQSKYKEATEAAKKAEYERNDFLANIKENVSNEWTENKKRETEEAVRKTEEERAKAGKRLEDCREVIKLLVFPGSVYIDVYHVYPKEQYVDSLFHGKLGILEAIEDEGIRGFIKKTRDATKVDGRSVMLRDSNKSSRLFRYFNLDLLNQVLPGWNESLKKKNNGSGYSYSATLFDKCYYNANDELFRSSEKAKNKLAGDILYDLMQNHPEVFDAYKSRVKNENKEAESKKDNARTNQTDDIVTNNIETPKKAESKKDNAKGQFYDFCRDNLGDQVLELKIKSFEENDLYKCGLTIGNGCWIQSYLSSGCTSKKDAKNQVFKEALDGLKRIQNEKGLKATIQSDATTTRWTGKNRAQLNALCESRGQSTCFTSLRKSRTAPHTGVLYIEDRDSAASQDSTIYISGFASANRKKVEDHICWVVLNNFIRIQSEFDSATTNQTAE